MQPVWAQHSVRVRRSLNLWEQSPPTAHLICRESRVRPINTETEGSLTPKALANWSCVSDHTSVVSQRYNTIAINYNPLHWSCKTPQYNLMSAMRKMRAESRNAVIWWNLPYNAECHGICRSLDELIKSRSVHLNRLALWTSIYKY